MSEPRCPQCKSTDVRPGLDYDSFREQSVFATCSTCGYEWWSTHRTLMELNLDALNEQWARQDRDCRPDHHVQLPTPLFD